MPQDPTQVVRLSVNLAPDVAAEFKRLCATRNITATEGVRRAIAYWHFVDQQVSEGKKLAVIENRHGVEKVREVMVMG